MDERGHDSRDGPSRRSPGELSGHEDAASTKSSTESETEDGSQIMTLYIDLLGTYGLLLLTLSSNDDAASSPGTEIALEQYGRLKVWGEQNRAGLPPQVHASLTANLRGQDELRKMVEEILEESIELLHQIMPLASTCMAESLQLSEQSDCESERGPNSDLGESTTPESEEAETFEELNIPDALLSVFDNIDELYRLGKLIRSSRSTARYLHSSTSHGVISAIPQDYLHVRQKIIAWAKQPLADFDEADEEENEVDVNHGKESQLEEESVSLDTITSRQCQEDMSTNVKDILCRRLAAANTRRRKQFKYWDAHPYNQMQMPNSQRKPKPKFETESLKPPPTVYTLSSVAKSVDNCDTGTTYAESVVTSDNKQTMSARVPDVPKVSLKQDSFECPYCHTMLLSKDMQDRQHWKRHVFRDIRPYVCTFPSCSNPDKLFATRYDWTYHENQMHRRQWNCQECHETFEKKESFLQHLNHNHASQWKTSQLSILLDFSERPRNEASLVQCPLCSKTQSIRKNTVHMAQHLEEISLFSLPKTEHDEDVGSKVGEGISQSSRESSRNLSSLNNGDKSNLAPCEMEEPEVPKAGDSIVGLDQGIESEYHRASSGDYFPDDTLFVRTRIIERDRSPSPPPPPQLKLETNLDGLRTEWSDACLPIDEPVSSLGHETDLELHCLPVAPVERTPTLAREVITLCRDIDHSEQVKTVRNDRSSQSFEGEPLEPRPVEVQAPTTVKNILKGREHICDVCIPPKYFTRAEHLRRHQLSHQTPGYTCPYEGCDRAFHRQDLLQRHLARHETEQIEEMRNRQGSDSTVRATSAAETAESQERRKRKSGE